MKQLCPITLFSAWCCFSQCLWSQSHGLVLYLCFLRQWISLPLSTLFQSPWCFHIHTYTEGQLFFILAVLYFCPCCMFNLNWHYWMTKSCHSSPLNYIFWFVFILNLNLLLGSVFLFIRKVMLCHTLAHGHRANTWGL